jgi:hypothetical protein
MPAYPNFTGPARPKRFEEISNDTAATMHCLGGPVENKAIVQVCRLVRVPNRFLITVVTRVCPGTWSDCPGAAWRPRRVRQHTFQDVV